MAGSLLNIDNVYQNNLGTFKKVIDSTLPVQYPDSYFNELFPKEGKPTGVFFSQLAYYGEIAIGAVKARLISNKNGGILPAGVYIEVLAVLEPYRGKGAGLMLLNYIEEKCKDNFQHDLYVHVATDNSSSVEWYEKNGFKKEGDILENYYKDTSGSPDAFVYKKKI